MVACRAPEKESYTSGKIKILVDDSVSPIIEDEAYVFENTYPKSKLDLIPKPENELLEPFLNSEIQVAILSRELTPGEAKFYKNRNIKIRTTPFAIDGIALITHQSTALSEVTETEVLDLMHGKAGRIKRLIFDNQNSSTIRYFKEKAGITNLNGFDTAFVLTSNEDLIRYVYHNPGTVGVISLNWMVQPVKELQDMITQLKVLSVSNVNDGARGEYYKPNQNDLALRRYPFTRSLYIVDCQGGLGLGAGFASFLAGEIGQRIVLKSGLLPYKMPSREVIIKK